MRNVSYYGGDERFPTKDNLARAAGAEGPRIFFLNWKPAPELTWAEVAAGAVDDRIDEEARYLKQYVRGPFFLSVQHEPEEMVDQTKGSGMTVADYRAMFARVVDRLRSQGLDEMVTVMSYRGSPAWASRPWFEGLYPGDDVVDWIAFDPYVFPAPGWDQPSGAALDRRRGGPPGWPGFYTWATRTHPDKPVMLGEWGISQDFDDGQVLAQLEDVRRTLRSHPSLKALIYWDTEVPTDFGATRMSNETRRRAFAELATSPEVTGSTARR